MWLGPADAQRFEGFQKALVNELEETVRQHALVEGYVFVGPVKVEIFIDDDLKPGALEVKTDFVGGESQPRLVVERRPVLRRRRTFPSSSGEVPTSKSS